VPGSEFEGGEYKEIEPLLPRPPHHQHRHPHPHPPPSPPPSASPRAGEYKEFALPEQFISKWNAATKKYETECMSHSA